MKRAIAWQGFPVSTSTFKKSKGAESAQFLHCVARWWEKTGLALGHRFVLVSSVGAFVALLVVAGGAAAATASKFGWQFAYDDKGRTTSITDPAGKRTRISYTEDENGRLRTVTQELPSGGKVTNVFDQRGRRERMIDGAGSVGFTYDKSDRLTAVRRDGMPALLYGYDTLGRIKSVIIGSQFSVGYEYDFRGRLEKITTPAGSILYRYSGESDSVVRRLPNGITTRWSYGPDGLLDSITHTAPDNKPLGRFQYTYRLDGLISTIQELTRAGGRQSRFGYDSTKRIVSVSGQNQPRIEYSYDKLGNRTEQRREGGKQVTSEYDWAGRLVSHDGRTCQHDAAGNLIACDGGNARFAFGDTGLLESASLPDRMIRYRYDGDGYLLSRNQGSAQYNFLYDRIAEIWRPLVITSPAGRQTFYVWDGSTPLMAITEGEVRYFLHDHLGSVRLIANRRGDITERREYLPFGEPTQSTAATDLQPGFAGLFFDESAALYLTPARVYDPNLGRFLQPDPEHRIPLGSQKDFSTYVYSGDDPLNFVDLTGLAPQATHQTTGVPSRFEWGWEFAKTFVRGIPQSISDQLKAMQQFDYGGILAGKYTFGASPRSFAHQAGRYGGVGAERAVQTVLGVSFAGELAMGVPVAYSAGAWAVARGALAGSKAEPFYFGMSKFFHYGISKFGPHLGAGLGTKALIHYYPTHLYIGSGRGGLLISGAIYPVLPAIVDTAKRGYSRLSETYDYIQRGLKRPMSMDKNFLSPSKISEVAGSLKRGSDRYIGVSPAYADESGMIRATESARLSSFQPTKVGGVRLAGAGSALGQLGELEGIALDETNGRLILLGKGQRPINLPPLRLDDVVTIFHSVYQHGEAPSVSIDPISDKKTERLMTVRHGPGTANTYVGWVLYEADRIMKTYQFGKDNRTRAGFYSQVPGYGSLYSRGAGTVRPIWERFWIIPSAVNGTRNSTAALTTFNVPLQVNTERMEWQGEKFVTARDPTPSPSAKQFQEWFTKNYNRVAAEAVLQPPRECGVNSRVAVFQELRRMALITAIAETLRNQNVPFPAWMRDYPVRPCPVDETTPILRDVERGEYLLTGGVQLAVPDGNRRIIIGDASQEQLTRTVQKTVATNPLFSFGTFNHEGVAHQAVTVPGAGSLRSGANELRHTDLVLPVSKDVEISLTRQFNSFHNPDGPFGGGWTLDLPHLERQPVPVSRDGKTTTYRFAYEVTSPLNSWSARFAEVRFVREFNGELMVPSTQGEMLGLTDSNNSLIGKKTKTLVFRDGSRWYFDEVGYLVAQSHSSLMVVYQRDPLHRIHWIKAWHLVNGQRANSRGDTPDAQMQLDYLGLQVKSIEASSSSLKQSIKAHYFYDKSAQLVMVIRSDGKWRYTYSNGLVTSIVEDDDEKKISFTYNSAGQLQSETGTDGQSVVYERIATPQGTRVVARAADTQKLLGAVQYDANFEATSRMFDDGSVVTWNNAGKVLETIITEADGDRHTISDTSDGRRRTIKTAGGITHQLDFDEAGRVTKINFEDGPTVQQKWHPGGRLQASVSDNEAVVPTYARDGTLSSVVVTTPQQAQSGQFNRYVKLNFDARERISRIEDDSGGQLEIGYDQSDQPSTLRSRQGTVTAEHNPKGQVTRVNTTWGAGQIYEYDGKSGELARIILQQEKGDQSNERATIEFVDGRVARIRDLDGGETILDYYETGSKKGLLQKVLTANKLPLAYSYDLRDRLTDIQIGDEKDGAYRVKYQYDSHNRLTGISYERVESK